MHGTCTKVAIKPATRIKSVSANGNGSQSDNVSKDYHKKEDTTLSWRKCGIEKRKHILNLDEKNGGNNFKINCQSKLRSYFEIADRVSLLLFFTGWSIGSIIKVLFYKSLN